MLRDWAETIARSRAEIAPVGPVAENSSPALHASPDVNACQLAPASCPSGTLAEILNKHPRSSDEDDSTSPICQNGVFDKPQQKFLLTLFPTILLACGKVNFTNLSRYSELSESRGWLLQQEEVRGWGGWVELTGD